jgi:hypothetical protein
MMARYVATTRPAMAAVVEIERQFSTRIILLQFGFDRRVQSFISVVRDQLPIDDQRRG